ncbi:MAG: universal stress protein [Burkholderiales bacterium]|nr:universal stress protein [Burkholderiales bacterium]
MIELRSLVVASDLSAPARRAADRAAMLARASSASLTLVHAISGSALDELRRWLDTNGGATQSILDDSRERLQKLASELGARYQISVDALTITGHAVEEIARIADERAADLVITGTLGAGFLRNRLLGSTAERLVKKLSRPVLMVRRAPRESYRSVLVPVDFSGWSGPSVETAAVVAPGADFVLMHAVELPFEDRLPFTGIDASVIDEIRAATRTEAMRRMGDLAARAGLANDRWAALTPAGTDPSIQIVAQEQEHDCDLIVIGKHGRNALEEFVLGSTTNRVIAESSADVLVSTRRDDA